MSVDRGTSERERQTQIAGFVRRFLEKFGATLDDRDGVLDARLPRALSESLGVGERLVLFFESERAADGPDGNVSARAAEFVTFGHPLLDKMLELAKDRGSAAGFLFAPALDPEFVRIALSIRTLGDKDSAPTYLGGPALALEKALNQMWFANARASVRQGRLVHQTQVLFRFKVAFISDEKRESIITLIIDPVSEEVDRPVDLMRAVSFTPHVEEHAESRNAYAIRRLYKRAQEHLAARIDGAAARFEAEVSSRMERELNRIEEYYRGLVGERLESVRSVFKRISAAGVRVDLARTWQTYERYNEQIGKLKEEANEIERLYKAELQGLSKEREQRLQEVREKYHARVEVSLLQGAYVMVPRFEWSVRLQAKTRRDITILYDVLRKRLVDFTCECCEEPLIGPVYLCGCEGLTCEHCHSRCSQCGGDHCYTCSQGRCHVCDRPLCPTCDTSCPLERSLDWLELPRVCGACRESTCSYCLPLSVSHVYDAL